MATALPTFEPALKLNDDARSDYKSIKDAEKPVFAASNIKTFSQGIISCVPDYQHNRDAPLICKDAAMLPGESDRGQRSTPEEHSRCPITRTPVTGSGIMDIQADHAVISMLSFSFADLGERNADPIVSHHFKNAGAAIYDWRQKDAGVPGEQTFDLHTTTFSVKLDHQPSFTPHLSIHIRTLWADSTTELRQSKEVVLKYTSDNLKDDRQAIKIESITAAQLQTLFEEGKLGQNVTKEHIKFMTGSKYGEKGMKDIQLLTINAKGWTEGGACLGRNLNLAASEYGPHASSISDLMSIAHIDYTVRIVTNNAAHWIPLIDEARTRMLQDATTPSLNDWRLTDKGRHFASDNIRSKAEQPPAVQPCVYTHDNHLDMLIREFYGQYNEDTARQEGHLKSVGARARFTTLDTNARPANRVTSIIMVLDTTSAKDAQLRDALRLKAGKILNVVIPGNRSSDQPKIVWRGVVRPDLLQTTRESDRIILLNAPVDVKTGKQAQLSIADIRHALIQRGDSGKASSSRHPANRPSAYVQVFLMNDTASVKRHIHAVNAIDQRILEERQHSKDTIGRPISLLEETFLGNHFDHLTLVDALEGITAEHFTTLKTLASDRSDQVALFDYIRQLPGGLGVIVGGPATGKTTILAQLLKAMRQAHADRTIKGDVAKQKQPKLQALVIAPTSNLCTTLLRRIQAECPDLSITRALTLNERTIVRSTTPTTRSAGSGNILQSHNEFDAAFRRENDRAPAGSRGDQDPLDLLDREHSIGYQAMINCGLSWEERTPLDAAHQFVHDNYHKLTKLSPADYKHMLNCIHSAVVHVLANTDVVITTAALAGSPHLTNNMQASVILADEAERMGTLELLAVLAGHKRAKTTILLGDTMQSQIYPVSSVVDNPFLTQLRLPLFNRLVACSFPLAELLYQSRFDQILCDFIGPTVGQGQLITLPNTLTIPQEESEATARILEDLGLAALCVGVRIPSEEVIHGADKSRCNAQTANATWHMVVHVLKMSQGVYKASDIAITTPYVAQVDAHKRILNQIMMGPRPQDDIIYKDLHKIHISVVDKLQGEQRKVVFFDCTAAKAPGMLKNPMTSLIACTRAQRLLVVVVDHRQLTEQGRFPPSCPLNKLFEMLTEHNQWIDLDPVTAKTWVTAGYALDATHQSGTHMPTERTGASQEGASGLQQLNITDEDDLIDLRGTW